MQRRREHLRAALHVFWTLFGTLEVPAQLELVHVTGTHSFLTAMSATGVSSPITLDAGMALRGRHLAWVSLLRLDLLVVNTPAICRHLAGFEAGRRCGARYWLSLNAWLAWPARAAGLLAHAPIVPAAASLAAAAAGAAAVETGSEMAACLQFTLMTQLSLGWLLLLAFCHALERRSRRAFLAVCRGAGERLPREPFWEGIDSAAAALAAVWLLAAPRAAWMAAGAALGLFQFQKP